MSSMKKKKRRATRPGGPPAAILEVGEGEEIAGMWASSPVVGGFYKLIAKRKTDGTIEWVHFIQRHDGSKGNAFAGTVADETELTSVVDATRRTLRKVYGEEVQLEPAEAEVWVLDEPLSVAGPRQVQ